MPASAAKTATNSRISAGRAAAGAIAAAVAASAANAVIASLGRVAGAPRDFQPLHPSSYIPLTVIGVLAGAAGWAVVRRWSRRPGAVLRRLVPAVIAVSLLPDLSLLFTTAQPHTTGLAVVTLMLMHLAAAAGACGLRTGTAAPAARRWPWLPAGHRL